MNPFTMFTDWLDEVADYAAPIGAFVGVGICLLIGFLTNWA